MSQADSKQNEPGKMKKLLTGQVDQSIKARLPQSGGTPSPKTKASPSSKNSAEKPVRKPFSFPSLLPASKPKPAVSKPVEEKPAGENTGFLSRSRPALWTIASVISMTINVVVLIVAVVAVYLLGGLDGVTLLAKQQGDSILGGLYNNFVKMDQAHIRTTIHVEKEIPVQFSLNVSGPTNVTLSQDVVIDGALVTVATGGLNIVNARARIVLPSGTLLPINIENLVVPVDKKVLAVLDVPVDIPLNQTELHEPFVGLRMVVEPFYCLLNPGLTVNGANVCP